MYRYLVIFSALIKHRYDISLINTIVYMTFAYVSISITGKIMLSFINGLVMIGRVCLTKKQKITQRQLIKIHGELLSVTASGSLKVKELFLSRPGEDNASKVSMLYSHCLRWFHARNSLMKLLKSQRERPCDPPQAVGVDNNKRQNSFL